MLSVVFGPFGEVPWVADDFLSPETKSSHLPCPFHLSEDAADLGLRPVGGIDHIRLVDPATVPFEDLEYALGIGWPPFVGADRVAAIGRSSRTGAG